MSFSDKRPRQQRGYGKEHQAARAAAKARHKPSDPCSYCGRPLGPWGPNLHLDHTEDRQGYYGMSHKRCNLRRAQEASVAVQTGRAPRRTRATPAARVACGCVPMPCCGRCFAPNPYLYADIPDLAQAWLARHGYPHDDPERTCTGHPCREAG